MDWNWQADLAANGSRRGRLGAVMAWFLDPGFAAVSGMRLAARYRSGRGPLAKVLSRLLFLRGVKSYGCFFAPSARIGAALCLPHPTGIVVGEGTTIGRNVTIYQGVTIGLKNAGSADYPVIEDAATIYAGAAIVGGVTIGRGAVIGANSVVFIDVPAGAVVAGNPAKIIKVRTD